MYYKLDTRSTPKLQEGSRRPVIRAASKASTASTPAAACRRRAAGPPMGIEWLLSVPERALFTWVALGSEHGLQTSLDQAGAAQPEVLRKGIRA
jgi:hypothetical protein